MAVKLKRQYRMYNIGEVAGFPAVEEQYLISNDYAEQYKPQKAGAQVPAKEDKK